MRFYRYTKARYALETLRTGHPKVATLQNPNTPFELLSLTVKTKEERSRQRKLILLPSRLHASPHLSMPAIRSAGSSLDRVRRPGRYLGIEVDDALEMAELTET